MNVIFFLSLFIFTLTPVGASADISKNALEYVPNGTLVSHDDDEVKIKTPSGTIIEVEFNKEGTLREASGNSVSKDIFVPGNKLLTLEAAAQAMTTK